MKNKNISKKRITLGTKQFVPMFEQFLNESEEMEDEDMEMEETHGKGDEDEDMGGEEEEMEGSESGEGSDDESEEEEKEVEERIQEAYRRGLAKGKKLYKINEDNWNINTWVKSPGGGVGDVKENLAQLQTVLSTTPAAKEAKPTLTVKKVPGTYSDNTLAIEYMGASSLVFGVYIPLHNGVNDPAFSQFYSNMASLGSFWVKLTAASKLERIAYDQSLFQTLISKPLSEVITEFTKAEKIRN